LINIPYKFKKPCNYPGCPELTDKRYCEKHRGYNNRNTSKYYNSRWQRERKIYLKANPFCVICLKFNKYTKANVVDHIKPHRGDMNLFWDKNNWQALCKKCHDKKTRTEDQYQEYTF
jgi:5-methylcytosine-specific restriction protein A